jgi:hypothetical protein
MVNYRRFTWLVLLLTWLVACAPVTRSEQPARPDRVPLGPTQAVGQTILSRYDGLSAVEVYLEPQDTTQGDLFFHLRADPKSQRDLRTSSQPLADITKPGFQRFEFQPIPDSGLQGYYFYLHTDTDRGAKVGTAPAGSYLNGSQYLNDLAVNAQTTFRLVYDPTLLILGLLSEGARWLWYVVVAVLLFVLPGWAALSWALPGWDLQGWSTKLTWSIGASLPMYPLLFLWTDIIGLHLGSAYAWIPPLAAAFGLLVRNRAGLSARQLTMRRKQAGSLTSLRPVAIPPAELALLSLAVLILLVRFWPVRALPAPMWGDSYQHTLIAQLLVDNHGLFRSWQPYADLRSFTYHFGFHSLVAVFHWLTGLSLPQATLWTGQIVNILAVLSLYPLAVRLSPNRWTGVIAVLIAGLLSPMPMYYVNWGRYTQLAGQAILPAAILVAWDIFERPRNGWRPYLLSWILFAGLALTHYRILVFAAFFFLAYYLLNFRRLSTLAFTRAALLQAGGSLLLFFPWIVRLFSGNLPNILRAQITTPASQVSAFTEQYNTIGNLFTYLPALLWLLLPPALAWAFWRREREVALIGLWWFLVFLSANPGSFGLPGSGVINNFAVLISAYIPVSLILGAATGWLIQAALSRRKLLYPRSSHDEPLKLMSTSRVQVILLTLILLVGLWGARLRLRDVLPSQFALVTWPDVRAAAWIQENLPEDARFLVNSFSAYGDTVVVGSDAGWWLPLLAGRSTTLPPLTYASETVPTPDYREWVNSLTAEIASKGIDNPDVLESLQARDATHVYIGQQQGSVNRPVPLLKPGDMLSSTHFTPVYHQDRVWIFKINQTNR